MPNNPWVTVDKDPTLGGYKVTAYTPTFQYIVSEHALLSDPLPARVVRKLAREMASLFAKELELQVADALADKVFPDLKKNTLDNANMLIGMMMKEMQSALDADILANLKVTTTNPEQWYPFKPGNPEQASMNEVTRVFHELIPGFAKMRQRCPVKYDEKACPFNPYSGVPPFLQDTIIHLNDKHRWTREQIADWLETLDHDLTFKTPEEVKNGTDSD